MRRLRLSTLLVAVNAGLLLLAVGGMAAVAVRLLRHLADEQALARVAQAGASAHNAVQRSGHEIHTSARLLAERPTLLRLLQSGNRDSLDTFLAQFQETSQLDGTGVMVGEELAAQTGLGLDWAALRGALPSEAGYGIQPYGDSGQLALWARSSIPDLPEAYVFVVQSMDDGFALALTEEIGLPVSIVAMPAGESPGEPSGLSGLRAQVLASRSPAAVWIDTPASYRAVWPLQAAPAGPSGVIETELSASAVTRSVQRLAESLIALAVIVAGLAVLANLWIGQRLGRPLQLLTRAAARIGQGDLATPVPAAPSVEIGLLAATLEDMRRRLLQLTANLRHQQAESQAILTGIVEGVFAVDRERRIQYINPQVASLLEIPAEAALGKFCGDVLNPQGTGGIRPCEDHCPIVHARFQAGARATEYLRLANGARRTVVITSAPPADPAPGDSDVRQVQVMRDETEAEAARRLRDAMLANISHEFRTPLSAQLASIELLLDQLPRLTARQIEDLVRSLQRGTLRLTQLIDNLLESVRIEAGPAARAVRRRLVWVPEVVEQAVEMMRPLLDQRRQTIILDFPADLPPVLGDGPRLVQVLVNLLANANKYAPAGSRIRVGAAAEAGMVALWVEDQGPGLPRSGRDELFVPFIRSLGEEPEARGVGLGLWIVKSIVERHGGDVEALNGSAGGARISVRLPTLAAVEAEL